MTVCGIMAVTVEG